MYAYLLGFCATDKDIFRIVHIGHTKIGMITFIIKQRNKCVYYECTIADDSASMKYLHFVQFPMNTRKNMTNYGISGELLVDIRNVMQK